MKTPQVSIVQLPVLAFHPGGRRRRPHGNVAWDLAEPDPEPPGQERWQWMKRSLTGAGWWRMDPAVRDAWSQART